MCRSQLVHLVHPTLWRFPHCQFYKLQKLLLLLSQGETLVCHGSVMSQGAALCNHKTRRQMGVEDKFSVLFFALRFNEEMLSCSCKTVVCLLLAAASARSACTVVLPV